MSRILKVVITFCFLISIGDFASLHAQDESPASDTVSPWTKGGKIGMNFTQVGLQNWAGGGENTIAISNMGSFFTTFEGEKAHWETTLEMNYGFTKIEQEEFRKSEDRIIFISTASHEETEKLLYSALVDFRTQFSNGYDYEELDPITEEPLLISGPFAPAYVNLSMGMTYKPVEYFEVFFGPLAHRLIIVLNDTLSEQGMFGVEPGEKIKNELGMLSKLQFGKEVVENVTLDSRLSLFAPYETLDKIVVTWETLLNMRVNSWLRVNLSADVIYDEKVDVKRDDGTVGPVTQFRNTLGIGVGYTF